MVLHIQIGTRRNCYSLGLELRNPLVLVHCIRDQRKSVVLATQCTCTWYQKSSHFFQTLGLLLLTNMNVNN